MKTSLRSLDLHNTVAAFTARKAVLGSMALAVIALATGGCQAPAPAVPVDTAPKQAEVQTIREGDQLKIAFPGTPNLDTAQVVRRDGRISLSIIGEVNVVGMTASDLEKYLAKRYSGQLLSSEVNVSITASSFTVFVTGAVLRPGKLTPDHPITALEAVMEAGGFNNDKADMENVSIIRSENGALTHFTLNLKDVLDGKSNQSFYLKPSDIVFVKDKFNWF